MKKTLMKLADQPTAVQQLFQHMDGGRYAQKPLKTRIRLLFDGEVLGGWADDPGNGQHWYVLENPHTLGMNPSYGSILGRSSFRRRLQGETRPYWCAKGHENTGQFKQVVEKITGVRFTEDG